jgi:transcriptional regulator with XRE-family HTH domain
MPIPKEKEMFKAVQARRFRRAVGARIVRLRQMRRWNQFDLADRLEVPRDRLAKWEAGCHVPSAEALLTLSSVLEISVDELLTGRKSTA